MSVRVLFRVDAAWPRLDSVDRGFAARDSAGREFAERELVGLEFEFAAREFAAPGFADRALAAPEVRFWLPERLDSSSNIMIAGHSVLSIEYTYDKVATQP